MPPIAPFSGFAPAAEKFFRDLAANQDRAWFEANKPVYAREMQAKMASLVADLIAELARRDIPLTADPAKAMFRIHRDVRFSREKHPYKTHAGAVLTRDGSKKNPGLLYIHFDPTGSFVAAGFYHPEPDALSSLREEILTETKRFQAMEAGLHKAGLELSRDESLVRLPRGFEHAADNPAAWALRLRNLVVHRSVPAASWRRPALVGDIAAFAADALPLLRFGWAALDHA